MAAWKALDAAITEMLARLGEIHARGRKGDSDLIEETLVFMTAESQARFLFGSDFRKALGELSDHVFEMQTTPVEGSMFVSMRRYALILKIDLTEIAERYMMLGHISVAKPKEPRVSRYVRAILPGDESDV